MLDAITLREAIDLGAETVAFPARNLKDVQAIIESSFHCARCGDCCRGKLGLKRLYLSSRDIKRLAEGLGISISAVKKLTFVKDNQRWLPLPCRFLNGNNCGVYNYRPASCYGFPILDEVEANGEACIRLYIGERCAGMKNLLKTLH